MTDKYVSVGLYKLIR